MGIFQNFLKRGYVQKIEKILEEKNFEEKVKILIIDTAYKIEEAYYNYSKVKIEVPEFEEYMRRFCTALRKISNISVIKMPERNILNVLEETEIKELNTKETYSYSLNSKQPANTAQKGYAEYEIKIFEHNLSLIYAIAKITNNWYKNIVDEENSNPTLTNIFVNGSVQSDIEVLRDFNSWSWEKNITSKQEIYSDIIFTPLLFLVGQSKLHELRKSQEFVNTLKKYMKEKYKKTDVSRLFSILNDITYILSTEEERQKIKDKNYETLMLFKAMTDIKNFLEHINKTRKEMNSQIAKMDKMLIDISELEKEYEKNKEELETKENIFSIEEYNEYIKEERKKMVAKNEDLFKIAHPDKYVQQKAKLEEKLGIIIEYENIEKDKNEIEKMLEQKIIEYQIISYQMLENSIDMIEVEKIKEYIYIQRYLRGKKATKNKNIYEIPEIYQILDKILYKLVNKGVEQGIINEIVQEKNANYSIIAPVLKTNIIDLEETRISLFPGKSLVLSIYDGNILLKEFALFDVPTKLVLKTKKKMKIFKEKTAADKLKEIAFMEVF